MHVGLILTKHNTRSKKNGRKDWFSPLVEELPTDEQIEDTAKGKAVQSKDDTSRILHGGKTGEICYYSSYNSVS